MIPAISGALVFVEDISNGQENIPISFINNKSFETVLESVSYIPNNILVSDTLTEDFESIPVPCKCEDFCKNSCTCALNSNIAYTNGILSEDFISGITKPVIECSLLCSCSNNCPNRVVQNGIKTSLQVFMTDQKGFGVRTLEFIPKLSFVCEYAGELIDVPEAKKRFKSRTAEEPNYIFVLKEYSSECSNIFTIIDPTTNGNVGRYLNHSCSPNLVIVPVRANSMVPRLSFFAKRDIMPYEELTYDYGTGMNQESSANAVVNSSNCPKLGQKKCHCDSNQCLGVLPFDINWLF